MPSMSRSLLLFAALFFIIFNEASVAFSLPVSKIRVHSIHTLYASARVESGIAGNASIDESLQDQCPRGYYLNSAKNQCTPLGPLGQISQLVETSSAPLRKASTAISTLFGIDASKISGLGVGFALSYSILSTLNGAVSLSFAWYLSCRRTGLSPFAPGQWKSLAAAYGTIYAIIQFLRPFRVAGAIAMSKLSREFLEQTEGKLGCRRSFAIAFQYGLGWVAWLVVTAIGVTLASIKTGVPILGQ